MFDCQMHAPPVNIKVDVSLDHGAPLHFFTLSALQTLEATFQARNNVSVMLAMHFSKSHTKVLYNTCTANRHLYSSGENKAQKRTKVSL